MYLHHFSWKIRFLSFCHLLYVFNDCFEKSETQLVIKNCSNVTHSKQCHAALLKQVTSCSVSPNIYPIKTYCYSSLISALQHFVLRPCRFCWLVWGNSLSLFGQYSSSFRSISRKGLEWVCNSWSVWFSLNCIMLWTHVKHHLVSALRSLCLLPGCGLFGCNEPSMHP